MTTQQTNLAPYKKQTNEMVEFAEKIEIKNEDNLKSAMNFLIKISSVVKKIQTEKEKFTKPAREILSKARILFGEFEKNYKTAEIILKEKMVLYSELVEKKAEKKIEKITEKVEKGKIDLIRASAKMEEITPQKTIKNENGKLQFRTIQKIVIKNVSKLPRKYLIPNNFLIKKDILIGIKIPGVEIKKEKVIAVY